MTHPLKIADSTHFRQHYLLPKSHKITVLEHASRGLSAVAELLVKTLSAPCYETGFCQLISLHNGWTVVQRTSEAGMKNRRGCQRWLNGLTPLPEVGL